MWSRPVLLDHLKGEFPSDAMVALEKFKDVRKDPRWLTVRCNEKTETCRSLQQSWIWMRLRWQWWVKEVKVEVRQPWELTLPPFLVGCSDWQTDKWGQAVIFMDQHLQMTLRCAGSRKPSQVKHLGKKWKDRVENLLGVPCQWFRAVASVDETHAACLHRWESPLATVSHIGSHQIQRPPSTHHHRRQWGHWNLYTIRLEETTQH